MNPLEFSVLLQVQKQESAEGMAMITAFAVVILGVLGYLGASLISSGGEVSH